MSETQKNLSGKSVDEKGKIVTESEESEYVRITPASPLAVNVSGSASPEIPKKLEKLPEAPTDYSLNIWENLRLFIEHPVDTVHDIILQTERSAMSSIIKSIILAVLAYLTQHFGVGGDAEIAGTNVESIITMVLYVLAGLVLPQMRYLTPKWLRDIFGWKDKE